MPMVWMRDDPKYTTRFHRTPDCRQLRKRPAIGKSRELVSMDLAEVDARPCRTCYPDAPQIKIIKRRCEICASSYPCEHNGGVLITTRDGRRRWTWPDTNSMPLYRRTG